MGADSLREEIFSMRSQNPPVPIRQIAAELGITASKVQRELKARATSNGANSGAAIGLSAELEPVINMSSIDPELRSARQSLERRRLALQEAELEARELEARARLERMQQSAERGAGGGDFAKLIIEEIRDLRSRMGSTAAGGGNSGSQSVVKALSEYSELGKTIASFAPPRAPTSALDLEFEIARERVQAESQRILKQQEIEAEIRRSKAEGEAARNHAMAKVIEETGPAFLAAATRWIEGQRGGNGSAAQAPAQPLASSSAPMLAAVAAVKGYCPRCGAGEMEIIPTGTDADKCPACGLILAVEGGQIVNGDRSAPAPEVARFAS